LRSGPRSTWKAPGKKAKMKTTRKMQLFRRLASNGIGGGEKVAGVVDIRESIERGECGAF
jgi:hypothetical protein